MDETIFQASLTVCKCVKEPTSYLEILNYSVRALPSECNFGR